jgi:glutamyl-Q tRNA(Asp) synthetase
MTITSRFAPSPTGFLHLGHAFSAWTAWRRAERFWLRLEDIDTTRCRPEFSAAILEDLAWLGLDWAGVRVQSEHFVEYGVALRRLERRGLLYPCFCSRAEILRAQAAPHGTDPVYPGTCRHLRAEERAEKIAAGAPYALRLDMAEALRAAGPARKFFEEGHGWATAAPGAFGDVILARRDVPTSYHLCVVHDDALQGVTHVIRGEDLRAVTHLHVLLQALLDLPTPVYAHHRLLTDASGKRLAKRDQAATLAALRTAGAEPAKILHQFEESRTA